MGQALYRKYRSKSLAEIIGQEHITDTLTKALKRDRLSHAYLFTGPRGVGKTSVARILAHQINQLPYDDEQSHIDIIEIDAASNNGVEDVRDLRDKVYVAPAQAKYKVYIIDEVHMLSKPAFNALLKTLEEPPAHVVFILATTEAHKLPATIVSRVQRFVFRPISVSKAVEHLRHIAEAEKIKIDDAALELIAQHGEGSFRDSISLLDQASGSGKTITTTVIRDLLGLPPASQLEKLLATLSTGHTSVLMSELNELYEQGYRAATIAKQLSQIVRQQLGQRKTTLPVDEAVRLLDKLLMVSSTHDPERYLEIILLEFVANQPAAPEAAAVTMVVNNPPTTTEEPTITPKPIKTSRHQTAASSPTSSPDSPSSPLDDESWANILGELKKRYNTLYGIARMAQPDFSQPGQLGLTFAFAFHQKRMSEAKNQQIIAAAINAVTGQTVTITCRLDPNLKLAEKKTNNAELSAVPPETVHDSSLATISNIFGGGELLQS